MSVSSWSCSACTYLNQMSSKSCEMCGLSPTQWSCSVCTFLNPISAKSCMMCHSPSSNKQQLPNTSGNNTEKAMKETVGNNADKHESKQQQLTQNIDEIKDPQNDTEEEEGKHSDEGVEKVAILVIGNSGTGKTSIIQLLSGKKLITSSAAERGTSEVSHISSKYNENYVFIDTIGLQDSKLDWTDDKLLKRPLQIIHNKGFRKIKIILCVSGETDCKKGPFCRSAQFIGSLKVDNDTDSKAYNETNDEEDEDPDEDDDICGWVIPTKLGIMMNSDDNTVKHEWQLDIQPGSKQQQFKQEKLRGIWESVLIIKKKGFPGDIDGVSGVLKAAEDYGATKNIKNDKHVFGFTCTEWNFNRNNKQYQWMNIPKGKDEQAGLFTEKRAREEISKKLDNLHSFELEFKHEICIKCGVRGDSRYTVAACHTKDGYFHLKPITFYHSGQQEPKHIGKLKEFSVNAGDYHSGQKQKPHIGQIEKYHPGTIKKASVSRVTAFIFTLSLSDWAIWKSHEWQWYGCCNKWIGKAKDRPCGERWSCCKKDPSATECSSPHAKKIWSCCNQGIRSKGCKTISKRTKRYGCCNKPEGDIGCEMRWSCCDKDGEEKQNRGCMLKFPCCDQDKDSKGCKRKCVNCKTDWGEPKGCIEVQ